VSNVDYIWYFAYMPVPNVNYCDGLGRCVRLVCIYACAAVFSDAIVFSANKDLYTIRHVETQTLWLSIHPSRQSRTVTCFVWTWNCNELPSTWSVGCRTCRSPPVAAVWHTVGAACLVERRQKVYFPHSNNTWISTQQKYKKLGGLPERHLAHPFQQFTVNIQ